MRGSWVFSVAALLVGLSGLPSIHAGGNSGHTYVGNQECVIPEETPVGGGIVVTMGRCFVGHDAFDNPNCEGTWPVGVVCIPIPEFLGNLGEDNGVMGIIVEDDVGGVWVPAVICQGVDEFGFCFARGAFCGYGEFVAGLDFDDYSPLFVVMLGPATAAQFTAKNWETGTLLEPNVCEERYTPFCPDADCFFQVYSPGTKGTIHLFPVPEADCWYRC